MKGMLCKGLMAKCTTLLNLTAFTNSFTSTQLKEEQLRMLVMDAIQKGATMVGAIPQILGELGLRE